MGEKHHGPFQLSFNRSWRIDVQGSRVAADGGLLVVRALGELWGRATSSNHT